MDVNGQAQNDIHTLAQGRALAEQHELESELVEEHESEDDDAEEHELRSEITEEHEVETGIAEEHELEAGLIAGAFGIADVLFPASPPAPVNARVIKLFSAEDEKKPRGLASAAGLFGVRRANPYDWRS
jgi:hypothetical protein